MKSDTDIVVIGSGITGLTVAARLRKLNYNVLVVEKNNAFGGVIRTLRKNDFVYETGPNTGVLGSLEAVNLFNEFDNFTTPLNDAYHLEVAAKEAKNRFILKKGEFRTIPSGPLSGLVTPLFKMKDKFRILGEPFRKPGDNPDESLADFVRRRMGNSFLDYAVDPFISGIYSGNPELLITKYAFPKLYNLEQNYGSLIGGSIKKTKEHVDPQQKAVTRATFSAHGGLSNLTGALYNFIGSENFIFSAADTSVDKLSDGYCVKFNLDDNACSINTKVVINTAGGYAFKDLYRFADADDVAHISNLLYSGVVECALGFKNYKGKPLNGFGGLIPSVENRRILGLLYMSTLFENRAPKGGALFSVFMGGIRHLDMLEMSDDEIKSIVKQEVSQIMHITDFKPDLMEISRHKNAIPQYGKGSKERIEAIEKIEKEFPGFFIGGNIVGGIGMSDRIKQGELLASRVKDFLV